MWPRATAQTAIAFDVHHHHKSISDDKNVVINCRCDPIRFRYNETKRCYLPPAIRCNSIETEFADNSYLNRRKMEHTEEHSPCGLSSTGRTMHVHLSFDCSLYTKMSSIFDTRGWRIECKCKHKHLTRTVNANGLHNNSNNRRTHVRSYGRKTDGEKRTMTMAMRHRRRRKRDCAKYLSASILLFFVKKKHIETK